MSAPINSADRAAVCCSAPGKVLLAGGYLILDRGYSGLVIGLDARIYATAETPGARPGLIQVRSPQFSEALWEYELEAEGAVRGVGSCVPLHPTFHPSPVRVGERLTDSRTTR